jgi:ABC-2 type transport system ATP-binding protein
MAAWGIKPDGLLASPAWCYNRLMETMLRLEKVSKRFGKGKKAVDALREVSLEIPAGQIAGLVGPNGAGKTTLLKILTGLTRADRGQAFLCGRERGSADNALVGFLPENPQFFKNIHARELLALSLRLAGNDFNWSLVDGALERVGLQGEGHRPIRDFSKGMRQRIGLAQAIIHDPLVLILDEPMSGLDPGGRILIKEILRNFCRSDRCILFSSHDLNDVEDLCSRVIWVEKGQVRLDAPIIDMQKQSGFEVHWQKNGRIRIQQVGDQAALWSLIDEIRISSGHLIRIVRRLSTRIDELLEIGRRVQ